MNPHLLYRFGVGDVLRGVIAEPVKQPSPELSHHLEKTFRFSNRTAGGLDLAAVNIQRGRDHGVPSECQHKYVLYLYKFQTKCHTACR